MPTQNPLKVFLFMEGVPPHLPGIDPYERPYVPGIDTMYERGVLIGLGFRSM